MKDTVSDTLGVDIPYADRDVTVCNKPAGMLSQRDINGEDGLLELLARECGKDRYIIDRLDRPVSGLAVFANTKSSAAALSASLGDHSEYVKEYLVCVSGIMENDAAILEDMLIRDRASGKTLTASGNTASAKYAKLSYRVLAVDNGSAGTASSLLLVRLYTGRTHQIRAQLSSRGHPVLGDGKYGSRVKLCGRIALHCFRVSFPHPTTRKPVCVCALPQDSVFDKFSCTLKELMTR